MSRKENIVFTEETVTTRNTRKQKSKGAGVYKQDNTGQWWYVHSTGRKRAKWLECVICGKNFPGQRYEKTCSVPCTYRRISLIKQESGHHLWKGGVSRETSGYIYILSKKHPYANKGGYVAQHRLVVEKNIGRYLTPNETVHHRNGIRDDNRLENLELFCKAHGAGQRVTDLIDFSIRTLERYRPDLLKEKVS